MNGTAAIRSYMTPPPGGEFFCYVGDERISGTYWREFAPRVRAFMAAHGIEGTPEGFVSRCMCPYMPDWYCSGVFSSRPVRLNEARKTATSYFTQVVVPFDVIQRRLEICRTCPKHNRNLCLSCTGILNWIFSSFGPRRVKLPEDKLTGTCECARTFVSVAASVDHRGLPQWEDVPETCWRNNP